MPVKDVKILTQSKSYRLNPPIDGIYNIQWDIQLWKFDPPYAPQAAYFSITGKGNYDKFKKFGSSFGRHNDLILKLSERGILKEKDKLLPQLIKWHSFSVTEGPSYYIENSLYNFKLYLRGLGKLSLSEESSLNPTTETQIKSLGQFKTSSLFGYLPDDLIPIVDVSIPFKLTEDVVDGILLPWLHERLPKLMTLFETDMVKWFGETILVDI